MAENLLTVEQAAERLHVHVTTARRHLRAGALRGIERGKLWRVHESALLEPAGAAPVRTVSALARAVELIKARDAQAGPVPGRSSSVQDLRTAR